MSITIIDTPKDVDFCRNPFAFKVLGSNYITHAGTKAHWQIEKIGAVTEGDTITWEFNGETVAIEFADVPDDSGNQISTVAHLSLILAGLKSNYYLDNAYDITLSGSVFHGVAKIAGSDYIADITITGTSFEEINPAIPQSETRAANYKIASKLFVEQVYDSGTYIEAIETLSDVDALGNAVVHINNKLKKFFTDSDLPAFNQATISKCTETIKRYYAAFWEYYGSSPIMHKRYISNTIYAINGLIPFNIYPGYDFVSALTASKNYMYNGAAEIETWHTAQQYLYFYNWVIGTNTIGVGLKIYYKDGTTYDDLINSFSGAKQYEAFIIPAGIPNLNLNAIEPSKTIDRYTISVGVGVLAAGKAITYKVINATPDNKIFLFQNDYGVFETLLCAKSSTELTVEKTIVQRDLPYNYSVMRGELNAEVTNDYTIYSATTINKTLSEIEHLRELLTNNEMYLQSTSNFFRCFIMPDTFKLSNEADDLHSLTFSYRVANNKNATQGSYDQSYNESYDIN